MYIKNFERYGLQHFIEEWISKDSLMGRTVGLKQDNNTYIGKAAGINAQGHLMVKLENGEAKSFSSGDTTILKNL